MKTVRRRLPFAVSLFVAVTALISAHAQITPSGDAYIDTTKPTINFGKAVTLGVVSPSQTSFIAFDLSSIPSGYTGSSIGKATLKLYVSSVTTDGTFNVDLVNGSWTEATLNANNAPALGATIAASVPLTKLQAHDYILIDITTALQDWLNGTPNDGIALVPNSPLSATFESKENIKESHNAELDVVYAGSGTITGVNTAAGSGLTGGGTSGTLNLSLLTRCSSGQTLAWNGSAWACQAVSGGTVTSVGSGLGLTGGPITTSGALAIDATQVPLLNTANTFTGDQTANGNLSATGVVTGSSFQIGSNTFAFGSFANGDAFLGFAGNAATTGGGNTATGPYALHFDTTGFHNTANGYVALQGNTTGSNNTAIGWFALASADSSYNTAIGSAALYDNTTGSNNTASGIYALYSNTTGNYNTAASGNSGNPYDNSNITGSLNTFLGTFSTMSTGSLFNATALGGAALVSQSNSLVLGSIAGVNNCGNAIILPNCTNTNVGIGITAPVSSLHVLTSGTVPSGNARPGDAIAGECSGTSCNGMVGVSTGSGYGVYAVNNGSGDALFAWENGSGKAGYFLGDVTVTGCLIAGGTQIGGGCPSDARLKTDIQPLSVSLDKVAELRPVRFNWRADNPKSYRFGSDAPTIGLIAQQVEQSFPEMVSTDKNGYKRVDYGRLPFLLLAGIRELKARNDSLSAHAHEQQIKIAMLSRQLEQMQTAQQMQIDQLMRQLQEVQAALKVSAGAHSRVRIARAKGTPVHQ
jgi:hypothetical protein